MCSVLQATGHRPQATGGIQLPHRELSTVQFASRATTSKLDRGTRECRAVVLLVCAQASKTIPQMN